MNSKKATTADMDEDTILEIVVRLPLIYAIRCMVLNKNLFRLISQQKKALVSAAYPDIKGNIFCRCNDKTFKRITPGSSKISSITIPNARKRDPRSPIILDSCNGALLLHFRKQHRICVFNPITGGFMPLSTLIKLDLSEVHVALAVDLDAQTIFQFKLVVAETFRLNEEKTLWKFTVLVPCVGTSWLVKPPVEFICRGGPCNCIRSVYVNGCVYWADQRNNSIIMFNVEKEKATSIKCPEPEYFVDDHAFLFGSSDGSLLSVYNVDHEMEIYSYDQVKDEWQLKHKITHSISDPDPMVLFCNGQHLLIDDDPPWMHGTRDEEVVVMYDMLSDKWDKFSSKDLSSDISDFFAFAPTLAKVSDMYLHDPKFKFAQVFLQGLQRLVMQETRDRE